MVYLDGHGDKYLWFEVYRLDAIKDGKTIEGRIQWHAVMNPSDKPECTAHPHSRNDAGEFIICQMSGTSGSAATAEGAIEIIHAHFDEFKKNNHLVVAKGPADMKD